MSPAQDFSSETSARIRFSVPLIPQRTTNTCWLAGVRMLAAHARLARPWNPSAGRLADPAVIRDLERLNFILPTSRYSRLARDFGLRCASLRSAGNPSPALIDASRFRETLWRKGPFFYSGLVPGGRNVGGSSMHGVVVTGMEGDRVLINDPWPPHRGERRVLSFDDLLSELQDVAAPILFL